jgi:hypothetical protein
MAMQTHRGSCHCGAVRYEVDIDLAQGTLRCNCSLCSKARAWFAFAPADKFRLLEGEQELGEYQWTPEGAERPNLHYRFCKTCGVRAFTSGKDERGRDIRAIAISSLDDADADELAASITFVDGLHDDFKHPPADTRLL